ADFDPDACDNYTNVVNVTGYSSCACGYVYDEDTAWVDVQCPCPHDISVEKYVKWDCCGPYSKMISASVGDYVTFRLYVNTSGDFSLVKVRDILPNGLNYISGSSTVTGAIGGEPTISGNTLEWEFPNIHGDHIIIEFKADVTSCGLLENVAKVGDGNSWFDNDHAYVDVDCPPQEISVEKYVKWDCCGPYSKSVSASVGDYVTFRLYVNISGSFDKVTVEDTLPSGLDYADHSVVTIVSGSVDDYNSDPSISGDKLTWTLNEVHNAHVIIEFKADVIDCGYLINQVVVKSDSCGCFDEDAAEVCVECAPCLDIEKYVSLDGSTWNSVGVDAVPGDTVFFKILVENCGDTDLEGVRINDSFPGFLVYNNDANVTPSPYSGGHYLEWFFPHIPAGESEEIIYSTDVAGIGFGYNTVSGCACGGSPCDTDSVWINASGGLVVQKRIYNAEGDLVKNLSANVGDTVRFNITVSYYGSYYAFDISVKDILPNGLIYADHATPFEPNIVGNTLYWNFSNVSLTNDAHLYIEFNVTVNRNGIMVNDVYVTGKECSGKNLEDSDSAVVVGGGVTGSILCEKSVWNGSAWVEEIQTTVGDTVNFNVSILNTGRTNIYWINIWDYLPSNLEYVNGSGVVIFGNLSIPDEPMSPDGNYSTLVWDLLDYLIHSYLTPGERISLHFNARVTGIGLGVNHAKVTALRGGTGSNLTLECWDSARVNVSISDNPPTVSDPQPENNATMVYPHGVELSVRVDDADGDRLNISFYAGNGSLIGEKHNVAHGSRTSITWGDLEYNTTYRWYVIVSDGLVDTRSPTWKFTTEPEGVNHAPDAPTNPYPSNGASNIPRSVDLRVSVSDIDGDTLTVRFYNADDHSLIGSDTVPSGGTASVTWSGLEADHVYRWYAVASDGEFEATSDTWWFRTEEPDISLDVSKIKGGFGIRATIVNNGADPADDVTWSITVKSARHIFARLNKTISGSIDTLDSGGSEVTDRLLAFGFGRVEVTVHTECAYDSIDVTRNGFIYGPFIFIRNR
ncbi:MAG: hypothetical protein DRN12_02645, partial [Thermoplasmata archaeon]